MVHFKLRLASSPSGTTNSEGDLLPVPSTHFFPRVPEFTTQSIRAYRVGTEVQVHRYVRMGVLLCFDGQI